MEYHPDPEIDREVARDVVVAEKLDLAAGFQPRRWTCPCGKSHSRGHVTGAVGTHRCLHCGYFGDGGFMHDPGDEEREA